MTSWIFLNLDTTPPDLTLGVPNEPAPGERLQIPFIVSDGTVTATLRDTLSRTYPMTISGGVAYYDIPSDFTPGDVTIVFRAVDDVGNAVTHSKLATIAGGVARPEPQVGGGRPINVTSLRKKPQEPEEKAERPVEILIPVVVWCVRTFELSVPVAGSAAKIVEFSAEVSIACEKEFEMALPMCRQPGVHFGRILQEDEELLLLM